MTLHSINPYIFLIYTNELGGSDITPGFRQGDTEANHRDLLGHLTTPSSSEKWRSMVAFIGRRGK